MTVLGQIKVPLVPFIKPTISGNLRLLGVFNDKAGLFILFFIVYPFDKAIFCMIIVTSMRRNWSPKWALKQLMSLKAKEHLRYAYDFFSICPHGVSLLEAYCCACQKSNIIFLRISHSGQKETLAKIIWRVKSCAPLLYNYQNECKLNKVKTPTFCIN